jgi:uncharacterized protein YecE (DUF72 family)
MQFGKVEDSELGNIDFRLPPDHKDTIEALKSGKGPLKVYVGCAKWGRLDWVGKIYPKGTKAGDFLKVYGTQFNSIELNSTFYQTPSELQVAKWYAETPDNFLFVPKFTNSITHLKRLKDVKPLVDQFLLTMSGLKQKLGPIFVMPEPRMGEKHLDIIANFIRTDVPRDQPIFLELRHDEWADARHADRIFAIMKENGTGSIITDTAGRRDMVHMRLTTTSAFIRFVGNSLHPTDYSRIDDWVGRILEWRSQGLEKLYFFMHQHDELYSPELCRYLIEKLNNEGGMALDLPKFVGPPSKLL